MKFRNELSLLSLIFLFILTNSALKAQDIIYNQYNRAAINMNPASAGFNNCDGRGGINFKNQWPGVSSQNYANLWADQKLYEVHGGVGFIASHTNFASGLITESSFATVYSYHQEFQEDVKLMIGIAPEFRQRKIDLSQLRFASQIQANRGFVLPAQEPLRDAPVNFFNLGVGILMQTGNSDYGFAIHNAFEPNQALFLGDEYPLKRRYTLHGRSKIKFEDREKGEHSLTPSIVLVQQDQYKQGIISLNYRIGQFETGIGYRKLEHTYSSLDALVVMAGVNFNNIQFLYSYDSGINTDRRASALSHELSILFDWCLFE